MAEAIRVEQHGATVFLFTLDNYGHATHMLPSVAIRLSKELLVAGEAAMKEERKTAECIRRRDENA